MKNKKKPDIKCSTCGSFNIAQYDYMYKTVFQCRYCTYAWEIKTQTGIDMQKLRFINEKEKYKKWNKLTKAEIIEILIDMFGDHIDYFKPKGKKK